MGLFKFTIEIIYSTVHHSITDNNFTTATASSLTLVPS